MEKVEENIRKHGSQWIFRCVTEEVDQISNNLLDRSSFSTIWDHLLKSYRESPIYQEKCMTTVMKVLNEMEDREVPSQVSSTIIQRLCMDLVKFNTEFLVNICNFCLKCLQSNKGSSTNSWKDLLPDTLRILSEKDSLEYNQLEYTGNEFKESFINTLCMSNWCPNKITQITAMFSDMSLTKEEHTKLVNKLSCYIEKLTPQEIPPFIYQLLRFCRHKNIRTVFLKLQRYFGLRIYSNTQLITSNNSSDFDIIENAEDHEILEAESMVLFHIQNAASIGHSCIKDYLNSLKNIVKSHEFILNHFQLLILLSISTVNQYEEVVFDIIRHSIVKFYNDSQKKVTSYWYRDIIPTLQKPEDVFKQIIDLGERDSLLEAFVNFGFALLNIGAGLGRDIIAEKQWTLGTMILLKIIKKKRSVASAILKTFCNHILTRNSATQYIECLYYLSKSSPLLILENQSCIIELMESLIQIPGHVAKELLEALMPLTKVSSTIRDQLLLILRKCIYSRSIETRQVAVYGYIKLLSTLKLSNLEVLSQNSNGSFMSSYSVYTQISLNRTTQSASTSVLSNEAICWEILGILKRCFTQQADVKLELYEHLFKAVQNNTELASAVLDVLWFHFMEFYIMDEESSIPIIMSNVAVLRDTDCVLQEPIGKLVFVITQIVAKFNSNEEKFTKILEMFCRRMANCELAHFELDDGSDLTDILPESHQKMLILKEILNIFEALLGYKIISLTADKENQCGMINNLFQAYLRFFYFGKNLSKPKKVKKTDKATQKGDKSTQKSTTSQANATKRILHEPKIHVKAFKVPDTLLDFGTVEKALKTLLESNVPWTTTNEANTIKIKYEMHRHFLQAAMHLVSRTKHYKTIEGQYYKENYDYIKSISNTLYSRIITRLSDYISFDCSSAMIGLECFHAILLLVNGQFKRHVANYLSVVGGKEEKLPLTEHLKPILEEFEKLFEADEDDLSNDQEIKKFPLAVLQNIIALCNLIPSESNILSIQVYDWLNQIACNNTINNKVAGSFMNLLCEIHLRYKSGLALFEHISCSFSDVYVTYDEQESLTEENKETLKIVNMGTANAIILTLCSFIKNILDDVESVIARIKSDYSIVVYSGEDYDPRKLDDLKSKEKGVTGQLCFIARILTNLTSLSLPSGNLSDAVFKNVVQFYATMSSLTKYFITKSTKSTANQAIWFEKLVKITGKKLAHAVNGFIYQLQQDKGNEEPTQKKKVESTAMKSKILKETKTIPKVVYEMERFSKFIMQLSRKTKYDLTKYVGQGISRDFRINQQQILDEMQRVNAENNEVQRDDSEIEIASDNEADVVGSNDENEDPISSPPVKKTKR